MSTAYKHTPGPYKRIGRYIKASKLIIAEVFSLDADTMLPMVENADFIVRACNAHDELVAALNSVTCWLVEVYSESDEGKLSERREDFPAEWKMIDKARAALELAKAKP